LNRFGPETSGKHAGKIFDMRANAHCALWTAGLLLVVPVPASAQDAPQTVDDSSALVPESPLTAEESAMLGNALVFDPTALATPPKKPLRLPGVSDNDFDITRTEMPDGSSTVVVKQPLQTEWSNSVGSRSWSNKRPQRVRSPAPHDTRQFSFGSRLGIDRRPACRER
jgi:hypothetical protein